MSQATDARRIAYVALDDLLPAERNPKRHRTGALTASVNRFGFVTPVLRDERTGRLVAGHGRAETLRTLRADGASPPEGVRVDSEGRWLVPVIVGWASRSDAEADAYLVADNRQAELGGWDTAELAELLGDLNDTELLEATGYDDHDLADMLRAGAAPDLDRLAAEVGEPGEGDTWPTIKIRCPQHIASAWNAHLVLFERDEVRAFAALLNVDAEAGDLEDAA